MSSVELRGISKHFGDTVALAGVDLSIPDGAYVVLLGPSGSGKTTLLMIMGGFLPPTTGEVLIDNEVVTLVPPAKRPTATVFQDYALFPHMSVSSNIRFGLLMKGVPKEEREQKAESMLSLVGLAGMGGRRIGQLSGGQRQRVALARSLIVDPEVLLLDEPLGALDLNLRRQMQDELKAIQQRVGTTFVHVTHDQDEAMNIADIIVVLSNGRIEDIGPPSRVYLKPGSRFTAMFMGDNNLFEGDVSGLGEMTLVIDTIFGQLSVPRDAFAQDLSENDSVLLGLRPEQIRTREFSAADDDLEVLELGEAVLRTHTFAGTHYDCTLIHEGSNIEIRARFPQHAEISANQHYHLIAFPSDVVGLPGE